MVRVEHDGIGAEPPELAEIVEDLVQGAGAGEPVSRRAMRGASVGRVLLVTASRRKGRVTRSGCQAASNLMARRIAAALLPPTQMGTRVVMPASQDSMVKGSKDGSGYRTATSGVTTS